MGTTIPLKKLRQSTLNSLGEIPRLQQELNWTEDPNIELIAINIHFSQIAS